MATTLQSTMPTIALDDLRALTRIALDVAPDEAKTIECAASLFITRRYEAAAWYLWRIEGPTPGTWYQATPLDCTCRDHCRDGRRSSICGS